MLRRYPFRMPRKYPIRVPLAASMLALALTFPAAELKPIPVHLGAEPPAKTASAFRRRGPGGIGPHYARKRYPLVGTVSPLDQSAWTQLSSETFDSSGIRMSTTEFDAIAAGDDANQYPYANSNSRGVISDYSGGQYIEARNTYLFHGGGHAIWFGNEVYEYNLTTDTWAITKAHQPYSGAERYRSWNVGVVTGAISSGDTIQGQTSGAQAKVTADVDSNEHLTIDMWTITGGPFNDTETVEVVGATSNQVTFSSYRGSVFYNANNAPWSTHTYNGNVYHVALNRFYPINGLSPQHTDFGTRQPSYYAHYLDFATGNWGRTEWGSDQKGMENAGGCYDTLNDRIVATGSQSANDDFTCAVIDSSGNITTANTIEGQSGCIVYDKSRDCFWVLDTQAETYSYTGDRNVTLKKYTYSGADLTASGFTLAGTYESPPSVSRIIDNSSGATHPCMSYRDADGLLYFWTGVNDDIEAAGRYTSVVRYDPDGSMMDDDGNMLTGKWEFGSHMDLGPLHDRSTAAGMMHYKVSTDTFICHGVPQGLSGADADYAVFELDPAKLQWKDAPFNFVAQIGATGYYSISGAVDDLVSTDTLGLYAGTYSEPIFLPNGLTDITITTIDGDVTIQNTVTNSKGIVVIGADDVIIDGDSYWITIQGCTGGDSTGSINVTAGSAGVWAAVNTTIRKCKLIDSPNGIITSTYCTGHLTLEDVEIYRCGKNGFAHGIYAQRNHSAVNLTRCNFKGMIVGHAIKCGGEVLNITDVSVTNVDDLGVSQGSGRAIDMYAGGQITFAGSWDVNIDANGGNWDTIAYALETRTGSPHFTEQTIDLTGITSWSVVNAVEHMTKANWVLQVDAQDSDTDNGTYTATPENANGPWPTITGHSGHFTGSEIVAPNNNYTLA